VQNFRAMLRALSVRKKMGTSTKTITDRPKRRSGRRKTFHGRVRIGGNGCLMIKSIGRGKRKRTTTTSRTKFEGTAFAAEKKDVPRKTGKKRGEVGTCCESGEGNSALVPKRKEAPIRKKGQAASDLEKSGGGAFVYTAKTPVETRANRMLSVSRKRNDPGMRRVEPHRRKIGGMRKKPEDLRDSGQWEKAAKRTVWT